MSANESTQDSQELDVPLSTLLIHLLRGPVYAQEKPELWNVLLEKQVQVKQYFTQITLDLYLDDAEGYAFLRQIEADPNATEAPPRMIRRRPLGLAMSVLCILLRKWLAEHDSQGGELRAIISRDMIYRELSLYIPEGKSEAKVQDQIDKYISQAESLGLVRSLRGDQDRLEILRITKALINANWLGNLDERLEQYRQHIAD